MRRTKPSKAKRKAPLLLPEELRIELTKGAPLDLDYHLEEFLRRLAILENRATEIVEMYVDDIIDRAENMDIPLRAETGVCSGVCATCLAGWLDYTVLKKPIEAHYPYFYSTPKTIIFSDPLVETTNKGYIKKIYWKGLFAGLHYSEREILVRLYAFDYRDSLVNRRHSIVLNLRRAGLTKVKLWEEIEFEQKQGTAKST
jgi:hypothetical protein